MSGKLYKVVLQGMRDENSSKVYGIAYVVATDPTNAYEVVRDALASADIGTVPEREMDTVELLADSAELSNTKFILYL